VKLLLESGAGINTQGKHRWHFFLWCTAIRIPGGLYGSALQAASLRGNPKIVQLLLESGADINIQGKHHSFFLCCMPMLNSRWQVWYCTASGIIWGKSHDCEVAS
jgi:ankyrin repeat protein